MDHPVPSSLEQEVAEVLQNESCVSRSSETYAPSALLPHQHTLVLICGSPLQEGRIVEEDMAGRNFTLSEDGGVTIDGDDRYSCT